MPDPARLSAQVITGVGFLGAGTILREGPSVKGLTTAASLWSVACLGIAAGAGYYIVAIAGMIFILVTLTIFEALQKLMLRNRHSFQDYIVDTTDVVSALETVNQLSAECSCELSQIGAQHLVNDSYRLTFRATFGRGNTKSRRTTFFQKVAANSAITSVQVTDEHAAVK
jgi:putative Mg2+ transporter-C (MgtC) family protein